MKAHYKPAALGLVIGLLLISIISVALAGPPPPLPSSFWGTAKVDGENVPDGTIVSAWINGVKCAETTVLQPAGDTMYGLSVPGDDPGTPDIEGGVEGGTVVFYIGDLVADQTGTWHSGTNVELSLTAGTSTQTIIVEKQTSPDGAPDLFTFTGDAAGTIADGQQIVVSGLQPGTYTSQETVPAGWNLTDIQCDDDNSSGNLPNRSVTFQLEAGEMVKCTFYNELPLDYGDAPDSYGTLLANDGARHAIVIGHHMGLTVDAEPDGQPSPLADGDDLNGVVPDDEDGVTLSPVLTPGDPAATVMVDGGPSGGMLDAWIDFNGNGLFDHPAEHLWGGASQLLAPTLPPNNLLFPVPAGATRLASGCWLRERGINNLPFPVPARATRLASGCWLRERGINNLSFPVPAGATPGFTYARFRLSMMGGLPPTGYAPDGEVEDCLVEIEEPPGTIIVEKQTDPDGAPDLFTFTGDAVGSISDGQQIVVSGLQPGIYSSQETVPAGWDLTSIVCDDSNSSGDVSTGTAIFQLEAGETVICTFTNTQMASNPPTLSGLPDQLIDHTTSLPASIDLWAYASDAETPVSGLTYTIEGTPPAGAGVTIVGNRYVHVNPSAYWCGYTDVTIRVTDPGGLWDTDTFRVAVTWSCLG